MVEIGFEKRLHDLMYSYESRDEMCVRVVEMESLVSDLWRTFKGCYPTDCMWHCPRFEAGCCDTDEGCKYAEKIDELGIEVLE